MATPAPLSAEAGAPRVDAPTTEQEPEKDKAPLGPVLFWAETAPAWLASGMLHLTVLILFALLVTTGGSDPSIQLTAGLSEDLGEQLIEESLDLDAATEVELTEQVITPDLLPAVDDPLATPPLALAVPDGVAMASDLTSITSGAALTGREPGSKLALLKAFGGTEATEAAVLEGLKWLARHQETGGSWSLVGPYRNGGRKENRPAATAMALLAFQGAGKLPTSPRDDFGRTVARGVRWLLEHQNKDGSFFERGVGNHRFYTHAQCTIVVCELLAMTRDERYRKPATRAVEYLLATQSEEGGWKYDPQHRSDLSVTGWVVMALKSARMAGIEVQSDVFDRVTEFLDSVSRSDPPVDGPLGSRYVYEPSTNFNRETIPALTAVGLLCRQYLGWRSDDPRLTNGVEFLLTSLPEWRERRIDVYYWYYATQVCLHAGGPNWPVWNKVTRELLPEQQEKKGRERGSWDPTQDKWGRSTGGRLYVTCLAIYTLEVYYRHLPLYQQEAVR